MSKELREEILKKNSNLFEVDPLTEMYSDDLEAIHTSMIEYAEQQNSELKKELWKVNFILTDRTDVYVEQIEELEAEIKKAFEEGFNQGFGKCKTVHGLRSNVKPDKFVLNLTSTKYSKKLDDDLQQALNEYTKIVGRKEPRRDRFPGIDEIP